MLNSGKYPLVNATSLVYDGNDIYRTAPDTIRSLSSDGELLMDNADKNIVLADKGPLVLRRLTLDVDGNLRVYSLKSSERWKVVWQVIQELCTIHGTCGVNAIYEPLESDATNCLCPPGYKNSSKDCQRKIPNLLQSKFLQLNFVSFSSKPDKEDPTSTLFTFEACKSRCLRNDIYITFSYKYIGKQECTILKNQLINGYWSSSMEITTFLLVLSSK